MAINLTIEQVKVLLKKSGQTISQENRTGNNLGTVLKLANGCNVNCWDKGTVNCQGKNASEIEKLLSAPTTGIPQNNKVFVVYGHDKNARTQLEAMLRRWDLEPLIIDQLPSDGSTIIEKLEKYQENFITKCFEKAETIVRDLEKLPGLSKIKFGGKDINIIKLELFEYEKDEKIRRMKEYIYKIVQDMEEKPEEMTKEVLNEKLSSKMLVGQIINIDKAYVKLYKIEDVQEHSTYKRWEEDLGSDGQVNAIYFMFAVCIISYISMLTRKDGSSKCKKVIIVDNPFGATSAVFLWKVMFEILKENNVQLIAPGHNISKEIISMFEVNYVLKHEFKDGNKKTVVVEQEFRTEDSLKNMNFDTIDGNQQKLF